LRSGPAVRVTDLTVELRADGRAIRAVDSINLDVVDGEIISIVGESGSGKTTLCRTIVGLMKPSSGSVEVFGKRIEYSSASLRQLWRQVQMVFQDPYSTFDPLSPILDSIAVPLRKFRKGMEDSEVRDTEDSALSLVGLDYSELEGKYPHELSGGQRQRASLARAIIVNPRILIADEPVSMLDASLRAGMLGLIKDLNQRQGLTIISVTHDLAAAEYISDRIGVMKNGRIVELAPTSEIIHSEHPYTRLLLRATPRMSDAAWLHPRDDPEPPAGHR
jgi:peptide/nickel transport system ATP-binding protein